MLRDVSRDGSGSLVEGHFLCKQAGDNKALATVVAGLTSVPRLSRAHQLICCGEPSARKAHRPDLEVQ